MYTRECTDGNFAWNAVFKNNICAKGASLWLSGWYCCLTKHEDSGSPKLTDPWAFFPANQSKYPGNHKVPKSLKEELSGASTEVCRVGMPTTSPSQILLGHYLLGAETLWPIRWQPGPDILFRGNWNVTPCTWTFFFSFNQQNFKGNRAV